ncbi:unnamed protein product [Ectocarpus sp. 13 AM-2016]
MRAKAEAWRVTWNMPTAAELRIPIFAVTDAEQLEFGSDLHGRLTGVAWPLRLKTVQFRLHSPFNQPIELVE